MRTPVLRRPAIQRLFNTLATAVMILSAPALVPAVDAEQPIVEMTVTPSIGGADLLRQLPLSLTFADRMGIAEFAPLSAPLTIRGKTRMNEHRAGDVAYASTEQTVVVFLTDGPGTPDGDLVLLGHVTSGLSELTSCVRDCVVTMVDDAR
ncbi:cyclophilin-like fold protein [Microbacterium rhizomatis]|uniref:Cyclophilin-like domain-containing protein n=1 Tax=Microbacterium rhizomatis TaxID=1631477 RepID=A0A5J5J0M6_9MICO|nr:cyclophilin-like fold protein [Microbacterium rhizomatis]KAA9108086.1 hypothetical protein F6B43_11780 [Microbacterium rhizomatis]